MMSERDDTFFVEVEIINKLPIKELDDIIEVNLKKAEEDE
jgi:hypothetical protein